MSEKKESQKKADEIIERFGAALDDVQKIRLRIALVELETIAIREHHFNLYPAKS